MMVLVNPELMGLGKQLTYRDLASLSNTGAVHSMFDSVRASTALQLAGALVAEREAVAAEALERRVSLHTHPYDTHA